MPLENLLLKYVCGSYFQVVVNSRVYCTTVCVVYLVSVKFGELDGNVI